MQRRRFVRRVLAIAAGAAGVLAARRTPAAEGYDASKHTYGMGVQVDKCIGCGRCVGRATGMSNGKSPTLRQITTGTGVSNKDLFALFPKGPAKKVAKIAGLGKPEGCV